MLSIPEMHRVVAKLKQLHCIEHLQSLLFKARIRGWCQSYDEKGFDVWF